MDGRSETRPGATNGGAVRVETMAFVIRANLDQPALWAAVPLPKSMRLHLSRLAALLAALAPEGSEVEVFAPMQIPPETTLSDSSRR